MHNIRRLLIIIGLVFAGLALLLFVIGLGAPASEGAIRAITIGRGDGFRDTVRLLVREQLIRSPAAFTLYSVITGKAHQFKPGTYDLSSLMSGPQIAGILVQGPKEDHEIVIIEGDTLRDVDRKLTAANILPEGALARYRGKPLEGFLFPDTYRFFPNSSTESVLQKFLGNFYSKAMPVLANTKNVYAALIIASMVEKEAPFSDDRPLIAGVMYERLRIGMPLQIDAATLYSKEVKNVRYDTYQFNGLPPTPISNPGLDAIKAAANPQKSEFLYYLSDPKTKKTIFSKTLEEHNANKAKYIGS